MMMETLRSKIMDSITLWNNEIEKSTDGTTTIDMSYEFEKIFSRNIITISFGEDVSEEKLMIMVETKVNSRQFVPKVLSLKDALHITED